MNDGHELDARLIVAGNETVVCSDNAAMPVAANGDDEPALVVPEAAIILSAGILSLGLVSALHLFVWLAFLKPDAANLLIPVIFGVVANQIWKQYESRKHRESQ